MVGTFWALVPPILAIVLALITKEAYSSLFIGVVVGALFVAGGSPVGALHQLGEPGRIDVAHRDARRPCAHRAEELRRPLVPDGGGDELRENRIGRSLPQRRHVVRNRRQIRKRDRAGRTNLRTDAPDAQCGKANNDKMFFHCRQVYHIRLK